MPDGTVLEPSTAPAMGFAPWTLSLAQTTTKQRLAPPSAVYYADNVKTLTVRLPEPLVNDIEGEARARQVSKSDVVRERLGRGAAEGRAPNPIASIEDLIAR